jgi:NAD(P)H-hydrate epimerase
LPPISANANKYSRGSLLVLAGSTRYFGAGVLAAMAAARSGAGYVTLATPGSVAAGAARAHLLSIPVIQAGDTNGAFAADALDGIIASLNHCDAIVLGCGITVTDSTTECVLSVIIHAAANKTPLLLDADALNVAGNYPCILTPHSGELKRLLNATNTATAQELALATGSVVVAKGATTTITNGERTLLSANATPARATAGTGDVLSGIIGSLLAQGMQPFEAAQAGVEIHSLAGKLAAEQLGVRSVIAEDVIAALPSAIQQMSEL